VGQVSKQRLLKKARKNFQSPCNGDDAETLESPKRKKGFFASFW
jgi:hypothetical protein